MTILITGMAGFIGFHVARRLMRQGARVAGLDNLNSYYDPALKRARLAELGDAAVFHEVDIADPVALEAVFAKEQPEVVIHLAAQAGVRYSLTNPQAYVSSNLAGHANVLEACRKQQGLTHLIYASSSSVYGDSATAPFSEDERADEPKSLYAATKRSNELMSIAYARLYGLRQTGLRFFTVYGPWGRPDMAYWIFTEKILKDQPITLFNHGEMRRDFTYIDDIVDGVVAIADKPPRTPGGAAPHMLFNIGNNAPSDLREFVAILEKATGKKARIKLDAMQPGDVYETCADITRIQAAYGFAPHTPLAEGLPRFVAWYREYFGI